MQLYYSPGTCALAPHIILSEAELPHQTVKVDLRTKKTEDGRDYMTINPKGYVPALELDDGSRLTEAAIILQYLADQVPQRGFAPASGTFERYRLQEWLHFISTEVHKQFSLLFNPATPDAMKTAIKEKIGQRLGVLAQHLKDKDYLMGSTFTVADAYLFVMLTWCKRFAIDPPETLKRYMARLEARPKVQEAMRAEGLVPS